MSGPPPIYLGNLCKRHQSMIVVFCALARVAVQGLTVLAPPLRNRKFADSPLEGDGFELVWGFPCQVVFFGLLPVLCSEAEGAVLDPVAYDQVPRARAMGSRDRNASKAWRLAALAALVFGSALTPEHAEER